MVQSVKMRNQEKIAKYFVVVLLILAVPAICRAWEGKVVGVSDGDTITVMHDGRGEKIRLYGH